MTSVCFVVQSMYERDPRVRRKAEALVGAGYAVDVLALGPTGGPKTYVLNGVNVRTLSLGKKRGSRFRYAYEYLVFFAWALARTTGQMLRRRYAVVDINTLPDFLVFAGAPAKWLGAKIVLDMHEITPEFYRSKYGSAEHSWLVRLMKWQERISFRFADHVLTVNEPIQDLLIGRGLARSKSTVVMNSADESRFGAMRPASRGTDAAAPGKFVMVYHGTLTHIYGLDIALEAFGRAHLNMPGAELWIIGSGPEELLLNALIRQYGLTSKVKMFGEVAPARIPELLSGCAVGVLPTRRDIFLDLAFPNKLAELVVTGKTVIVARLQAIRRYFSDAAVAYFEPNRPDDLARQMVRLYRDPALRDRLARQARREYLGIRWDIMKERYLTTIDRLATASQRDARALAFRRRDSAA